MELSRTLRDALFFDVQLNNTLIELLDNDRHMIVARL